ncbi:PEP-CTERM sorting domain-containing protein [Duganella sp. BJB488]|nr:PEP-CTERM sorting domain-containing protein [Duganella sp. BJB488]
MIRFPLTCIASALLCTFGPAQAATSSLSPSENMTFINFDCGCIPSPWDPDAGFRKAAGGTAAGGTNWMVSTIFVRFKLPTYVAGSDVTNADLVLMALSTPDQPSPLGLYVTGNSVDPWSVHRDDQPYGQPGTEVAFISAAAGVDTHVDLTSVVNAAYHNDGVVTFLLGDYYGHYNYQYFASDKTLDLTISAVPEPATYAMMLAGLGLMAAAVRRRQRG